MPIYSYRCADCGFSKDVLQKISDPPPAACPSCGASAFRKQVTAAGFQLKGSGWYVTDFRNPSAAKPDAKVNGEKDGNSIDSASNADKPASNGEAGAAEKAPASATADAGTANDKPAASPVPGKGSIDKPSATTGAPPASPSN